ncbi:MAG TPA: DNA methyltransferase [Candidatus Acidoferrales bacterium]|nr:DNA methyltransferase [Candidatus Acidoferrales bacterium]
MSYSKKDLEGVDWDFPNIRNEGMQSFHWYPATFVSAVPGSLIPLLTKENAVVLDPFCGTSVTGLEAIRLNRSFIGVDSNPIAILISQAKLLFPDLSRLHETLSFRSRSGLFAKDEKLITNHHPKETELKRWYHKDTYKELLLILHRVKCIRETSIRIPAQAIFSSILKTVSSQWRHWGWVCDNVAPKHDEIIYKDAFNAFHRALEKYSSFVDEVLDDMQGRGIMLSRREIRRRHRVSCADSNFFVSALPKSSVDLIMTSPPYYGVADYVKSQRLSFLWFEKDLIPVEGYSFDDFEELRKREMGQRSSRNSAKAFQQYVDYMHDCFRLWHSVLKRTGLLAIVLGDSSSRQDTSDLLEQYATEAGFRLQYNTTRRITTARRRLIAQVKTEYLKIYSK